MARKGGLDRGIFEKMAPCPKCNGKQGGCAKCKHNPKGQVGTDVWYVRFTDANGKDHKQKIGTKTKATQVYQKMRSEIVEGTFMPEKIARRNRIKMSALIEEYMKESRSHKRSSKDDERYAKVWTALLGNRPATGDIREDVLTWRRDKSGSISKATINRHVAFLKRVFSYAIESQTKMFCHITNPLARLKMLKEENERVRFLTADEEKRLREHLPPQLWHFVEVAINTGLRQSEQFGLRWEYVDFTNGIVTVPRAKNSERRNVKMNATVRQVLRGLPSRLKSEWVYPGKSAEHKRGARASEDVGHLTYPSIRVAFEDAVKKAGLGDFHWHDLRHTFASRLAMTGVPLITIKELMGHKTLAMVARYAHLSPEHLGDCVERLALFSQESPTMSSGIGTKSEPTNAERDNHAV